MKNRNHGCVPELESVQDPRNYDAEAIMGSVLAEQQIDYSKVRGGVVFDIEVIMAYIQRVGVKKFRSRTWSIAYAQEIMATENGRFITPSKNQIGMDNCVWQAKAFYGQVLNFIETGKWVDLSSIFKFWQYALAYGTYIVRACISAVKDGFALEEDVPSYRYFKTDDGRQHPDMDSAFARNRKHENETVYKKAKEYQAKGYAKITSRNLERIAQISILNFGCLGGYYVNGMSFKNVLKNIFRLTNSPKSGGHCNYFGGKITLEQGRLTIWSKDSYDGYNDRDKTNGWLGHQEETLKGGMYFNWYTIIDAKNIGVVDEFKKEVALKQLLFMNGRKTKDVGNTAVMFIRVEKNKGAKGQAYLIIRDKTGKIIGFKYLHGRPCDLFGYFVENEYLVPIPESLWEKIKYAEIK